ncbi:FG-GAP-like repeat-containing protein [Sphaerisporangium sp. NPDC051011]|uniref:FG-GAP-like repeat-containing protein n=1 Tax=Sphaerisporangium sp. NPDC051011 TaxID=3155792 RepID=UPI0033CB2418
MIAVTTTPAAAVSRDSIVSVAQSQLNNSSRNHEQPLGSGCNYYTGYFRTWKPAAGCPATDGVQWRDSDWCADFSKYVWKNAGVPYADVPETSGGVLTGWVSSFKDYGTMYGTWHTRASGYTPQPGDALVFDWDQNGVIDHVGIVKSANSSTVYTIEGNSGDRVKENSYSRTNIDIVGYSSPVGAGDVDDPAPRPVVDPQAGRLVDFDGDGKPDFLGLGSGSDDMWFIPNTSTPGALARGQSIPMTTGWKTVSKYWLTDYDGDGKTDVLGLNGTDQMLAWTNTSSPGQPSVNAPVSLGTQWSTLSEIVIGDFTGDGEADIAGVDAGSGDQFWVVPNTSTVGAPARGQSMLISSGWKTVTRFWVTDYDGDGKTDLLGLNGTDQMFVWRNKGTAVPSFDPYVSLGTLWSTFSHIPTAQ